MEFQIPVYKDCGFIDCLKPYQQEIISQLLSGSDEEGAAKMWLSSNGPLNLRQFGGVPGAGGDAFYDRFVAEFRKFVCGGKEYDKEREEFMKVANPAAGFVVTTISVLIATTLGVAVGLIVPAVALLLRVIGKIGVNAWCKV